MSRTALPADCESGCPYLRSGNAWTPSRLPMAKAVPPSCESWGEPASNARPPVANEHSLTGATLGLPVLPSDRGQFLLRPPETSTRCKTQECARDQLLLELLERVVLLSVSTISIGGIRWNFFAPRDGGSTPSTTLYRAGELSPRLSLRRAKTACPEPTPANSLDRGSRK
jgi:hypothetical protein